MYSRRTVSICNRLAVLYRFYKQKVEFLEKENEIGELKGKIEEIRKTMENINGICYFHLLESLLGA